MSAVYNTFWWVDIVTEVNVHEGDLKIEFFTHMDLGKLSGGHLLLINVLSQHQTFYVLSQLNNNPWANVGVSHKFDLKKIELKIKIVFSQRFLHHKLPKQIKNVCKTNSIKDISMFNVIKDNIMAFLKVGTKALYVNAKVL